MLDRRLFLHLATWLGQWPAGPGLHVVRSHRRARPAWDGRLRPAIAVAAPDCTILSVPPDRVGAVRALVRGRGVPELLPALPATVGLPTGPPTRARSGGASRPRRCPTSASGPRRPGRGCRRGCGCSTGRCWWSGTPTGGIWPARGSNGTTRTGTSWPSARYRPPGAGAGPAAGGAGGPPGARRGRCPHLPAQLRQRRLRPGRRGGRLSGPGLDVVRGLPALTARPFEPRQAARSRRSVTQRADQVEHLAGHRAQHPQPGQPDQPVDQRHRAVDQLPGLGLVRRAVVHPVEDHPHVRRARAARAAAGAAPRRPWRSSPPAPRAKSAIDASRGAGGLGGERAQRRGGLGRRLEEARRERVRRGQHVDPGVQHPGQPGGERRVPGRAPARPPPGARPGCRA